MNEDERDRSKLGEYEAELKIAKTLDKICEAPGDTCRERMSEIKGRLVDLLLRLRGGELSSGDAKTQSVRFEEEISKLIWALDDWAEQFGSRN